MRSELELKMWESLNLTNASQILLAFQNVFQLCSGNSSSLRPYYAFYLKSLRNVAEKQLVDHVNTTFAKLFTISPHLTENLTISHRTGFIENRIRRLNYIICHYSNNFPEMSVIPTFSWIVISFTIKAWDRRQIWP